MSAVLCYARACVKLGALKLRASMPYMQNRKIRQSVFLSAFLLLIPLATTYSSSDAPTNVLPGTPVSVNTFSGDQWDPAVTSNTSVYLAAWTDFRKGGNFNDADVYATRVSADGTVLDPDGFVVSDATTFQGSADIASDGEHFLLVWSDYRNQNNSVSAADIYAARVDRDGHVLDPTGIPVFRGAYHQLDPAIAWNSQTQQYLIVWHSINMNSQDVNDIYAACMDKNGQLIHPEPLVISVADAQQSDPSVEAVGDRFLVVWRDDRNAFSNSDIYGTLVDQDCVVSHPKGFPISHAVSVQYNPRVAWNADHSAVVWWDHRNHRKYVDTYNSPDIYGTSVNDKGRVEPARGFPVTLKNGGQFDPDIAAYGDGFFVVFEDEYDNESIANIMGTTISDNGSAEWLCTWSIGPTGNDQKVPAVASGNDTQFVVWEDQGTEGNDILGKIISTEDISKAVATGCSSRFLSM